ncbi:CynX/NimT family MFS transporter [Arthrobacter ginkgonis]|uniref:CynX/NimT family MFS transporter n=1 Tax=Arthrobacter ginkgonis TaxID=1630594 RepID=A0ABP7CVN8_9MICC
MDESQGAGAKGPGRMAKLLPLAAIYLTAAGMRPVITSLAAVLDQVRVDFDAPVVLSLLVSSPMPIFAMAGFLTPLVVRRLGTVGAILAAIVVCTVGLALRPWGSLAQLVACTVLALCATALINVLLPALTASYFPDRIGSTTGAYTGVMTVSTTIAAAATAPLALWLQNWNLALTIWVVFPVLAALLWLPLLRRAKSEPETESPSPSQAKQRPTKTGFTALLVVLFATQAALAFTIMGWFPTMMLSRGLSADVAGYVFALLLVVGLPVGLIAPTLFGRGHRIGVLATLSCATIAGCAVLLVPNLGLAGAVIAALLLGTGTAIFPVVLAIIGDLGRLTGQGVALSGRVQSLGYATATAVPLLAGLATGSDWSFMYIALIAVACVQFVAGARLVAGIVRLKSRVRDDAKAALAARQ